MAKSQSIDWFDLIRSEIESAADDADEAELLDVAKHHSRQVVDRIDEIDVDVDEEVEWSASKRLKGKHGVCKSLGGGRSEIRLSIPSLRYNGWEKIMNTTRHELVHAWQNKHDKKEFKHGVDYAHDTESFERWIDVLDISKKGPQVTEYKYECRCTMCGSEWGYHRMCKSLRSLVNGTRYCANCGPDSKGEVEVRRDGEVLTEEMISESDGEEEEFDGDRVFLYNRAGDGDRRGLFYNAADYEWTPETADLTDFYGIGEEAAKELEGEFVMIDEMVDGDGLHERVREAVPAQFVDELAEKLQQRLDGVREKRDADLELLEKAEADDGSWWEWRENFDGIGGLEHDAMVMKDADEGDELEVETVDHEIYVGRVVPSEVLEEYVKLELKETGIDAYEVNLVTKKNGVWSRPRLIFIDRKKKEDGGMVEQIDSTDVYGVFWP